MLEINHSLLIDYTKIAENLENKATILGRKPSAWHALVPSFFSSKDRSLLSFGREISSLFDKVEKIPTKFSADEVQTEKQRLCYAACLKTANAALSLFENSKSGKVKGEFEKIMLRVAGLKYRIEGVNGGLDRTAVDPVLAEQLCAAALAWKHKHPLIYHKKITDSEINKLEEVSTYPEFARLVISSKYMQDSFFCAALRDNNDLQPMIEFPATSARLKSSYILSRVGKLADKLKVFKKPSAGTAITEKIITLPFFTHKQTEDINILDESRIVELDNGSDGVPMTINQIFRIFSEKNRKIGDLEFFQDGIRYWNCHKIGSIDLTLDEWWKQLPLVGEMSKTQLEGKISQTVEEGEWVVFAKGSRTTPDMDLDGRHGYIEIAIPTHKGTYGIYPFGIFPEKFPATLLELASFLGNTFRAKISYPDENYFYSHRQQASAPIKLTPDEASTLMKTLQRELIMAKGGHAIFQFGAENCAFWAQTLLNTVETKSRNYFELDYVKSYPLNPVLNKVFSFFRALPPSIRGYGIRAIDTCFGTHRSIDVFENGKRVSKSHNTSRVRNKFVIFQPGLLHQQIQEGTIDGTISLGNC